MHLHHLQGFLTFYFAEVTKIIKITKSIKSLDQNVHVIVALTHVGVLTIYKIVFIYIRFVFVGLDNKLYQTHGTYIKMV